MEKKIARLKKDGRELGSKRTGTSREGPTMKKKASQMGQVSKSGLSESANLSPAVRERIALRAYTLYERRGWVHGLDVEDWLEAERLVLAESQAGRRPQAKAEPKPKTTAASESKVKTPVRESEVSTKSRSVLGRS
jgi:Protein of unknown function (DUF2934)